MTECQEQSTPPLSPSDQMRITASSLLFSLTPPLLNRGRRLRTSEDSTKLSTMLHWISNVISSNTAASISHDAESDCFTFYLCSNSFHEASMNNATRLLGLIRKSLSIVSTKGNQADLEEEYLSFVSDVCWGRLQNKVNNKVPRFRAVPHGADVSTMSLVLKTIIELVESWKAWRFNTGLPEENSLQIARMRQKLNHTHSTDTLKHCFEQAFRPLDDTGDRLQQLRHLWRCCYALLKSDFFVDVFYERWKDDSEDETWFLRRVYRRIWRLYSYRRGADVLLYRGIPHLLSMTQSGCPPDITFCWVPHESPSTVHMDVPPDQFIFEAGQRYGWQGDLAQDSQSTSEACCLWSVNETRTVHVHPMVSMVTFLYSSRISVMENRIGTSRRPCILCDCYAKSTFLRYFNCAESSIKLRVDWAIPRTLPVGQFLVRDDVVKMFAAIRDNAEQMACAFLTPQWYKWGLTRDDAIH